MSVRKLVGGAALAMASLGAGPSFAGGNWLPSGLEWGDDVKAIQGRLGKVEPDLCKGDERPYYRERGWSCEGILKPGLRLAGSRFNVRLRMSEGGYRLANVNMLSKIDGTKTDRVGRLSLLETCDAAQQVLSSRFGSGTVTSAVVSAEAVRKITMWVSPDGTTEVKVACLELPESDFGEVMVDFAPIPVTRGLV
jgi:hypothetical protein